MRFKSKYYLKEREGERRVVHKFLLLPRRFKEKHVRWLEYANIIEQVKSVNISGSTIFSNYAWRWVEVGFADTEGED